MGELIATTNIQREANCLYYVKPNPETGCIEVYKAVMARGGKHKKSKKGEQSSGEKEVSN